MSLLHTTVGILGFPPPSRTLAIELICGLIALVTTGVLFRKQLGDLVEFVVSDFQIWLSESHMRNVFMPVYKAELPRETTAKATLAEVYAEDEEFAKFRAELLAASLPQAVATPQSDPVSSKEKSKEVEQPWEEVDPLKEFYSWLPERLARLRDLHHGFSRSEAPQELLRGLLTEISALRERACLPELVPVRQMAAGLEGLVKQMSSRFHEATPSTLRTVASGIDLLNDLCAPNVKADIVTVPPIRLLAVDDDQISRVAVTFALKKAFNQPDLASDGEEALALATREHYDVIFLDVQMPGMDGFELCSKIRQTEANAITPIVFVTVMKDFDARAKSVASGGNDLIGKPFLPFEITVKSLTFALRRRLKASGLLPESTEAVAANDRTENSQAAANGPATSGPLPLLEPGIKTPAAAAAGDDSVGTPVRPDEPSPEAIRAMALEGLGRFREHLQEIGQTEDEPTRQKMLASLHTDAKSLALALKCRALRPLFQIGSTLESLLKKLNDKPSNATPSTLKTVETAVDLLKDLCLSEIDPDIADKPPIGILVVDDDLLTRRAITGALQMAFLKPDNVGDGESAVAKALDKQYDVIFMDVQMPGLDGFAACAEIRKTVGNRDTPVVFVTSYTDFKSRQRSSDSGGNDYVTKPFLFQELNVKALTFALRGRLQRRGELAPAA